MLERVQFVNLMLVDPQLAGEKDAPSRQSAIGARGFGVAVCYVHFPGFIVQNGHVTLC